MILSGREILRQIETGNIGINPFELRRLNPNSYNLTLHPVLECYVGHSLYTDSENVTRKIIIPEDGMILHPGVLYLARTNEYTKTHGYVPMLEGRSSLGRLGLHVHATAGFGDVGFEGFWTLELSVVERLHIYPNIDICQIFYHTILGDYDEYNGKYQKNDGIQGSLMYQEFDNKRWSNEPD
jgi:dCTP deaminase